MTGTLDMNHGHLELDGQPIAGPFDTVLAEKIADALYWQGEDSEDDRRTNALEIAQELMGEMTRFQAKVRGGNLDRVVKHCALLAKILENLNRSEKS